MILTVLISMYCSFLCEKILTFYVCFFLAYFKTGSCCNLDILWIQDSNDVSYHQRKWKKKNLGLDCFRKNVLK